MQINTKSLAIVTDPTISPAVYDVFRGIGWNNHSRFTKQGHKLLLAGGEVLTKEEYNELYQVTNRGVNDGTYAARG